MKTDTSVELELRIRGTVTCTKCLKRLTKEWQVWTPELELKSFDNVVLRRMRDIESELESAKQTRGWNQFLCGSCRDQD